MDYRNPPPSAWVFARIALALAIAGVLAYGREQGLLTWPLILMTAFISGVLVLEMFTADREKGQRDFDADGRPAPGHRATGHTTAEVDAQSEPEDRVRTSPGIRR